MTISCEEDESEPVVVEGVVVEDREATEGGGGAPHGLRRPPRVLLQQNRCAGNARMAAGVVGGMVADRPWVLVDAASAEVSGSSSSPAVVEGAQMLPIAVNPAARGVDDEKPIKCHKSQTH